MAVLDSFRLDSKVAVVTGGNRGLGEAYARALGEAGARVAIAARDEALSATVAEGSARSRSRPTSATPRPCAACSRSSTATLGPVDVLVNNAGVCYHRPALEVPDEEWRSVWDVNVDGVWHCSAWSGAQMIERGTGHDHQRRLDLRRDRQPAAVAAGLQRLEGGGAPAHEVAGRRVGAARRARQRARARLREDGDGAGRRPALPPPAGSRTRRCSAPRRPRRSPPR